MIPPEVIEKIRETVSLVEFIGKDVVLKKSGNTYKGLCPFHNERTPSFMVYPDQNRFHCFGCGKSGNIFTWLAEKQGLGFVEAVHLLAGRYGIEIPEEGGARASRDRERRRVLLAVNEQALTAFRHGLKVLPAGKPALQYLLSRGVSAAAIDVFKLGFALPGWDALCRRLSESGFEAETLIEAGLCRRSQDGARLYDYFRQRVMFPIHNERGELTAFGGRVLDGSEPKYLNSPESPLFSKRRLLYGIHLARTEIGRLDEAILVEGYLDVIGMHQAGFRHTVAPLGTSLTEEHLTMLGKLTKRLLLFFDGDAAGRRAVFRAARMVMDGGFSAAVVLADEGADAFDMARTLPAETLSRQLKRAVPLDDFVAGELYRAAPVNDGNGRLAFLQRVYDFLDGAASEVQAATLVRKAAVLCGLAPEEAVTDFMNRRDGKRHMPAPATRPAPETAVADLSVRREDFEQYLLRLAFAFAEAREELARLLAGGSFRLEDPQALALAAVLYPSPEASGPALERVSDPAWHAVLEADRASGRLGTDWLAPFSDTMKSIQVLRLRRQRRELAEEVRRASLSGDRQAVADLQRRLLESRQAEEHLLKHQDTRWWRHG